MGTWTQAIWWEGDLDVQPLGTIASGDVSSKVIETARQQITSADETERAAAAQRLGDIKDVAKTRHPTL